MECPACGYVRQETDDAPDWQCPNCKRAYNKIGGGHKEYSDVDVPQRGRVPHRGHGGRTSASIGAPNNALAIQLIGLIGSALLIIGPFAPFISAPFIGSITLFKGGEGDGIFILGFGLIALLFSFTRRYTAVAVAGCLSGALLVFTFINTRMKLNEVSDNPFLEAVSFQWGGALIVLGVILTIAPAVMVRQR